jgi:hypothetical protein
MEAHEIEKYLSELGAELKHRGIKKPVPIMIIGGAYMLLLENAPRTTDDVDVFWLEEEAFQRTRELLSECVLAITSKYALSPGWFNYLTQVIMQNDILIPEGELWKQFGPLHIYVPPKEYILALKITAGRDKDLEDCAILFPQSRITTYEQAKQLLDRYILPKAQEEHAEQIERSLDKLFKNQ